MSENPSQGHDPQAEQTPAATPAPVEQPARAQVGEGGRRGGGAGVLFAIVLALAAVALTGWHWYETRTADVALRDDLARRLAEAEARNREALQMARASREIVRELDSRVTELDSRTAESQNQQVALAALYQEMARNRDEWSLSEIEQTLTIAAQQLQLAGNVRAAIVALQSADARLQRMDRPQLAGLRKVIVADIQRLQATPYVDVVGLSARLDVLGDTVDVLPLAMHRRPSDAGGAGEPAAGATPAPGDDSVLGVARSVWRDIWADLKGLVRIQSVDEPEAPLLAPSQAYFLRENLKLRLLSARFALLQHDPKNYRTDLEQAAGWLRRHFDTEAPRVKATLDSLKQLAEAPVGAELPDIGASLDAVRNYRLTREPQQP